MGAKIREGGLQQKKKSAMTLCHSALLEGKTFGGPILIGWRDLPPFPILRFKFCKVFYSIDVRVAFCLDLLVSALYLIHRQRHTNL